MKKKLFGLFLISSLFALSACRDDSSSNVSTADDSTDSSSSITETTTAESSSSVAESENSVTEVSSFSVEVSSSSETASETPTSSESSSEESPSSAEESSSSFVPVFGSLTDARNGKIYKTVKIGEQEWMAENLNLAYPVKTKLMDSLSYCMNSNPSKCDKYGRLYIWSAATDSAALYSNDCQGCGYKSDIIATKQIQGICPIGWHLTSQTEWEQLFTFVGKDSSSVNLRTTSGWNAKTNGDDGSGKDLYGFSIVSGGFAVNSVTAPINYMVEGGVSRFWSATTSDGAAVAYNFNVNQTDAQKTLTSKEMYAHSVRCVKN